MCENPAAKDKDSSTLKENKLLQKGSEPGDCCRCTRPCKLAALCIVACCIFVVYWFMLCPLLISSFTSHNAKKTEERSVTMLVLSWVVAFVLWLTMMLILIFIWRCFLIKKNDNVELHSYGTSGSIKSPSPIHAKYQHPQIVKFSDVRGKKEQPNDSISDTDKTKIVHDETDTNMVDESRQKRMKKHRDLPPLVIHRWNSGNCIEKTGTVNVEETDTDDEDEGLLESGNYTHKDHRESMKDYLKLVTVTPNDEVALKSPKGPLSPRELFFIDLIREAEKAERNKENSNSNVTEGKHFFPSDYSSAKNIDKDSKDSKKDTTEVPTSSTEHESTFFIAAVESPINEKTEVFLEIEENPRSVVQWSVNLNDEEPVIKLQENLNDTHDRIAEGEVVLFEV